MFCCEARDVELNGFSDSSGKAYENCVFIRVSYGQVIVGLIRIQWKNSQFHG